MISGSCIESLQTVNQSFSVIYRGKRLALNFQRQNKRRAVAVNKTQIPLQHTAYSDLSQKTTLFLSLVKRCKRGKGGKWVIELRRLLKDGVKEEQRGRWNRGDICAYGLQLKGWYPDGEIRERGDKGERGQWKWRGRRESEREAENGHHVGCLEEERIAAPVDFGDGEIVIEGKHLNARWIEEVWISIPVDALSKTDSSVVYYDPSRLRDIIN